MKCQILFSEKNKNKYFKMSSADFFSMLSIKAWRMPYRPMPCIVFRRGTL